MQIVNCDKADAIIAVSNYGITMLMEIFNSVDTLFKTNVYDLIEIVSDIVFDDTFKSGLYYIKFKWQYCDGDTCDVHTDDECKYIDVEVLSPVYEEN